MKLSIAKSLNKIPSQSFLDQDKSFIWHISDLHLSQSPQFLGHGHCNRLLERFFSILGKRANAVNDIIVITGDCTDDGNAESVLTFLNFLDKLEAIGILKENILFVPGNHDAWNGKGRIWNSIISYGIPFKERWIRKAYWRYPKREMPGIFSRFKETPSFVERKFINNKLVDFILVNTSVPNEMARGIFPLDTSNIDEGADIRIALMHHHLVTDISKSYVDEEYFSKVRAMRVLNPHHALNYIFQNQISISLHGHKHLQYYRKEPQADSTDVFVNLISAPSLSENHYNAHEGEIIDNNTIGFNILILEDNGFGFYPFVLKLNQFILKDYKPCKYK